MSLRLALDEAFGGGEEELSGVGRKTEPLAPFLTVLEPKARLTEISEPSQALGEELISGNGVKSEADGHRLGVTHSLRRGDDLDRRARADQSRQALGSAPGGKQAELGFGQADFGLRTLRDEPVVHREDQFGAAAHAIAVNQRDSRKRQRGDRAEKAVTESNPLEHLLLGGEGKRSEFIEVGPGDELTGLAAPEQEPLEIGPLGQAREDLAKFEEHGLSEGVDLLIGKVESQDRDLLGVLFESKGVAG